MSQTLHPLTFPLSGSRLIEASAGTGKTYTIAALYLRLILCHGNEAAFSQPLLPPQILVMTFTEAATQELRDRIRARLVEAAAAFRNPDTPADALLASLREDFDPASWAECAWRLDTAAQWMDESAVMTLHAWCQRMLREHAFDSGSLFDLKVKTNHQGLYDQVIRDYWRTHCYTLGADGAAWVHAHWKQPHALWQRISLFLKKMEVDLPADATCHEQPLQTWFDQQHGHFQAELTRLKQDARSWVADLFALLTEARDSKLFNAQGFNRKVQERAEQAFQSWLDDPAQVTLSLTSAQRKRLTVDGLKAIWKEPESAPDIPALRGLEGLADQLEALQRQHDDALLWHAVGWTRQRFVSEKRQRAEMGFVDMLLDLRDVLRSASGTQLAETIRQRFPVAMVDEFQDTDPVQYEILDAVYDLADPAPHTALVLIGDPKQSIYGFRGADIHAYLRARRATQGRHYTLPVNYRSSAAMVAAVNHLFAQAEDRSQGQGAFLYRTMTSADADKSDNPIPFQPVDAHHVDLAWQQGGQRQPALTLWHGVAAHPTGAEDSASQDAATEGSSPDAAESCASAIVALLNDATASYTDMAGTAHGVAPGDIAVLVRDRHEARNIRQALSRRGVHSVYLSNADSVYQTQEAADMQLWLTACLHPQDERCLKSALAAPSLGLPLQTLQRYHHDEQRWEEAVLQFAAYGERWRTHGVLPMVHQLLHDYGLPGRLMQQPAGGERALTNILHLAEVLQQQARELDGQRALLQFLQQAGDDPESVDDQQILRLESDSALLRVVTLHKAKGLEYPFVFLPFINRHRPFEHRGGGFVLSTDGARAFHLHAAADDALHQQAERNRLAEDLRLFYVGLTRAQYACWLGVEAPEKAVNERDRGSALGYLLGVLQPDEFEGCLQTVSSSAPRTAGSIPCMAVRHFPVPTVARYTPVTASFEPQARVYDAAPRPPWWVASYSALLRAPGASITAVPETAAAQVLVDDEPDPAETFSLIEGVILDITVSVDAGSDAVIPSGIHALPRGAVMGNFLHDLLERAMQPDLAGDQDDAAEQRAALLEQLAERHGHEAHLDVLRDWMHALWNMRFALSDGRHFCLDTLTNYQVEMEFWFAANQVNARQIDALVTHHVRPGHKRPGLAPEQVNGLLKGFMDLVFAVDGSYYVLDYKSNHLGPDAVSYVADNMWAAMLRHRYDLQAVLYTLALHRHLQTRIPDYDYDRHIGGALYLFLRGIQGPEQGLVHVRPPRSLIEALDALFAGQPEPESS